MNEEQKIPFAHIIDFLKKEISKKENTREQLKIYKQFYEEEKLKEKTEEENYKIEI